MIRAILAAFSPLQRSILKLIVVAVVIGWSAQALLKRELFDAAPYFIYMGGSGPYEVLGVPIDGAPEALLGDAKTTFKAGDFVGFRSNLTVEPGVGLVGEKILVRLADGREVRREVLRMPSTYRRQGDRPYYMRLPTDLKCGLYEIRVRATFEPPGRPPIAVEPDQFTRYPFEIACGEEARP